MKNNVVENLEGLANGDLGWKAPRLIFVDDEGKLGELAGFEDTPVAGPQQVQEGLGRRVISYLRTWVQGS